MIVPIDKPVGMTSHDVVNRLRRFYGIKKIGHAGTLDPFATGVLIMLIGRESTKKSDYYMHQTKIYQATLQLGSVSDSYDRDGRITVYPEASKPPLQEVELSIKQYIGHIQQIPPMHSAIKVNGKKLYELARQGIEIVREPREVEIIDITVDQYEYPQLVITVQCSSGTYIRSLARDIGESLHCGAYLTELRRLQSGEFRVEDCYSLDSLPQLEEVL